MKRASGKRRISGGRGDHHVGRLLDEPARALLDRARPQQVEEERTARGLGLGLEAGVECVDGGVEALARDDPVHAAAPHPLPAFPPEATEAADEFLLRHVPREQAGEPARLRVKPALDGMAAILLWRPRKRATTWVPLRPVPPTNTIGTTRSCGRSSGP